MNAKAVSEKNVFEEGRLKEAQKFFNAHVQLTRVLATMISTAHAVTQDTAHKESLYETLRQIVAKRTELDTLLDSFLPPRPPGAGDYDQRFVVAGHNAENRLCDHSHYNFREHGRNCTCGTIMNYPGD